MPSALAFRNFSATPMRVNPDISMDADPATGFRTDHAFTYLGAGAKGFLYSFREITYEGTITYCDATGNCASRPNTLSTAKGYDSMTGLGSIGPDFIPDLAK